MNTTQLLLAARRLSLGPTNSLIATDDASLLSHADSVIRDLMLGIYALKQDFCTAKQRRAMTSGTNSYQIPKHAFNGLVRHVLLEVSGSTNQVELDWIDFSRRQNYTGGTTPSHFWFEGDDIVVNGSPTGNIVLAFPFTPGELVTDDDYRVVSSVNTTTKEITLTSAPPSAWTTSSQLDIIDANRAGGPRVWDNQIAGIAGSVLTMTDEIDGSEFGTRAVEGGDYVALAGYAGRPMIPEILHEALAQGIVARVAQSQGDGEAFQVSKMSYESDKADSLQLLRARSQQIRIPINLNSHFRRNRLFRRRYR